MGRHIASAVPPPPRSLEPRTACTAIASGKADDTCSATPPALARARTHHMRRDRAPLCTACMSWSRPRSSATVPAPRYPIPCLDGRLYHWLIGSIYIYCDPRASLARLLSVVRSLGIAYSCCRCRNSSVLIPRLGTLYTIGIGAFLFCLGRDVYT